MMATVADVLTTNTLVPYLLGAGLVLALAIPSLLLYGYLANRVAFEGEGLVQRDWFGPWDALVAGGITLFYSAVILYGAFGQSQKDASEPYKLPETNLIVLGAVQIEVLFISIVLGIIVVLKLGGFSWRTSLGLGSYPPAQVVGRAVLLLLLAYPLISISSQLWQILIASVGYIDASKQDAVRFLAESKSQVARLTVAVQAVVFAPVQEELIFRACLYGLVKRYLGFSFSLLFTSALFAGIHQHLPSFAGLFILAVCLTLAYEWTGSILVPMAMHALFNLLTVIVLFR